MILLIRCLTVALSIFGVFGGMQLYSQGVSFPNSHPMGQTYGSALIAGSLVSALWWLLVTEIAEDVKIVRKHLVPEATLRGAAAVSPAAKLGPWGQPVQDPARRDGTQV